LAHHAWQEVGLKFSPTLIVCMELDLVTMRLFPMLYGHEKKIPTLALLLVTMHTRAGFGNEPS
jgi:hypothetical protein